MTTTIGVRFPLGRYHATPWGRTVNEAVTEWPPSPWRLLRCLYATWRWRAPELPERLILDLLSLLTDAPSFRLPRYQEAHSRHYMPDVSHRSGSSTGRDKVLDPFVVLDPQAWIYIRWPASLDESMRAALSRLCDLVSYLGRAESICHLRLVESVAIDAVERDWLEPGGLGSLAAPPVRVLAPTAPLDLRALLSRTTEVRHSGRITPPGSRWVPYQVPGPEAPRRLARGSPTTGEAPTAVRFRLAAAVLPSVRDTVLYGHMLHLATMYHGGAESRVLTGKNTGEQGKDVVRHDSHQHAHYLALDTDGDRLLDTAVVWAPEGFGPEDLKALLKIRHLSAWGLPGFRPVRVAVEAIGTVQEVAPDKDVSLCGPSQRWRSVTPFAPYRHQRRQTMEEFLSTEVTRELTTRALPTPAVELLRGPDACDWLSFRRQRPGKGPDLRALGIEICFPTPVRGPLALGALSHFGLGLFGPVRGSATARLAGSDRALRRSEGWGAGG